MKYLSRLKPNQLKNKICLLRIDLNIEINKNEAYRVWAVLPTIKFLLKSGARIVILSHKGRPKNREAGLSLKPFAKIFSRLLGKKVFFAGKIKSLPKKTNQQIRLHRTYNQ